MDYQNKVALAGRLRYEVKAYGNGPAKLILATQDKAFPAFTVNVWGELKEDIIGLPKDTNVRVIGQMSSQKVHPPATYTDKAGKERDVYEPCVNVDAKNGGKVDVLNVPKPDVTEDDLPF